MLLDARARSVLEALGAGGETLTRILWPVGSVLRVFYRPWLWVQSPELQVQGARHLGCAVYLGAARHASANSNRPAPPSASRARNLSSVCLAS